MTFAFGHLIGGWLVGKLFEKVKNKKLSSKAWFALLLGAILPDIDYLIDWTLNTEIHRTITHSLIFVIIAPVTLYFILYKNKQRTDIAILLGIGISTHFILDILTSSNGIPLLWPNLLHISIIQIAYFDPNTPSFLYGSNEQLRKSLKLAIIDMALGTLWLFYLWWKKRIDF